MTRLAPFLVWTVQVPLSAIALAISLLAAGCFTRTVYVPAGKSVLLRQELRAVKIWAKDSQGRMVPGVLTLREGWIVLPADQPLAPELQESEVH